MMELKANTKVKFLEKPHVYYIVADKGENRKLEGVTTMLKNQGLSTDFSGISEAVIAHAAARGSAFHHLIDDYNRGKPVPNIYQQENYYTGQVENFLISEELKAFKAANIPPAIETEFLVSDNKNFATKIDYIIKTEEDGVVDLIDHKYVSSFNSGYRDYTSWEVSCGAYLLEKQCGVKVRNIYAGWMKKEGDKYTYSLVLLERRANSDVRRLMECEIKTMQADVDYNEFLNSFVGSPADTIIKAIAARFPGREKEFEGKNLIEATALGRRLTEEPFLFLNQGKKIKSVKISDVVNTEQRRTLVKCIKTIAVYSKKVEAAEAQIKEMKDAIYEFMLESGKTSLDLGPYEVRLTSPSTSKIVDSDKLKKDGLFEKYSKTSNRKGSIKFVLKK